jgi:hypothetical protein
LPCNTGGFYVTCLRTFVTATQQNHNTIALATKINPIPWAVWNPQLAHSTPDRFAVTEIAKADTVDSYTYARTRFSIS